MHTVRISTLNELRSLADSIVRECSLIPRTGAWCIALSGDLGAGKTAFVKELAKVLGVREEVTSPTFVVMKSYAIPAHPHYKTLTHVDAYRIESDDEMRVLRFEDVLDDPMQIVCVEWSEKIEECMAGRAYPILITLTADGFREIQYGT